MKTRIVEKSSGRTIVTESNSIRAIEEALNRRVAIDDMLFVIGEPDIQMHTFASSWAKEYRQLSEYYRRRWGNDDIAEEKLLIHRRWAEIAKSRLVPHEDVIAKTLTDFVGELIASELEILLRLSSINDAAVFGPVTGNIWPHVYRSAAISAKRNPYGRTYVAAHHEKLGLLVTCPAEYLTGHLGFKIVKEFFGVAGQ